MSTPEERLVRQISTLRRFYGALSGALDSLYPGYHAAAGGPDIKGAPSELLKAKMLLEEFADKAAPRPEFQAMLEEDYARIYNK